MKDQFKIEGFFTCKVFENGKLIKEFAEKNLVVDAGKKKICQLLQQMSTGGGGVTQAVNQIGFGSGTSAPVAGDTTLSGSIFIKPVTNAVFDPGSGKTTYNWILEAGEANGITITEFGLLYQDHTLFARKCAPGTLTVAKNASITITGAWEVTCV